MRKALFILFLFYFCANINAQNASGYFPDSSGFVWYYEETVLDKNNEPIDDLTLYSADSFGINTTFEEKNAKKIWSKSATKNLIRIIPYINNKYYSFDGNTASQYFHLFNFADSSLTADSTLVSFLLSFQDWFDFYDFGAPAGEDRQIYTFSTDLVIDDQELPVTITIQSNRLGEENVSVKAGVFDSQKFEISINFFITYVINVPVIGDVDVSIKVFSYPYNVWIAQDNWIVKEYAKSKYFNIDTLGLGSEIPSFTLPGYSKELIPEPANINLFTPNGGETFADTSDILITWAALESDSVKVEYSLNCGTGWNSISENHAAFPGFINWNISGMESSECLIKVTDLNDSLIYDISDTTFTINKITSVVRENTIPSEYSLSDNYPNPFNPETVIQFSIPEGTNVKLEVYNAIGEKAAELVNGYLDAGNYTARFRANHLSSGIYFYILSSDAFTETKKMILLK